MIDKLYIRIAACLSAIENCKKSGNKDWQEKHELELKRLVQNYMPSGSGFDNGTYIDANESRADKLVFKTSFHHMNQDGYYDGWSHHAVIVTPSLVHGINLRITGRDKNGIKDYIADSFYTCLTLSRELHDKAA